MIRTNFCVGKGKQKNTSKVGTHREKKLGDKETEILSNLDILTKPCPNCFEIIEKIEGCDHAMPFCKLDFC